MTTVVHDDRYHVRLRDDAAGEELGLLLGAGPQSGAIGFSRNLVNPYAAKLGTGDARDSDLTEWSLISWRDWRSGRGQEDMDGGDPAAYYDSWNVESRIEGQLTLGPLPKNPVNASAPRYEPGSTTWYFAGWPGPEAQTKTGDSEIPIYLANLPEGERSGGQLFLVKNMGQYISSVKVCIKKMASTTAAITLSIYSDNGKYPHRPNALLASKSVAAASVGTSFGWVTFTLDTPLSVTNTGYWIVLSSTGGPSWNNGYVWSLGAAAKYGYTGNALTYIQQIGWLSAGANRNGSFEAHYAKLSRAQSFAAPAGGITCTSVQLYSRYTSDMGQLTISLCSDSGGSPGATLKSQTLTPNYNGWYEVTWGSGQALTGGATYWIVVEPVAERTQPTNYDQVLMWGGRSSGGYGSGACKYRLGAGSWTSRTEDMFFRVNRTELNGTITAFARYDDNWYCAAGDSVYKWDSGTSQWATSDQVGGKTVTSLESWGGYLWAGRGSSNVVRRFNGATWANVAGVYAKLLKAGGGYLNRSNGEAGHQHEVLYTADGTTWSDPIEIGAGEHVITGMAWYRDALFCANAVSLWSVAADMPYPVLDWASQEDANNGVGMLVWSRTGCLYIPLRYGLYRWNGDTMLAVGPEQGMGLPSGRAGYISALCGTNNWLYVSICAGASGTSSILAYGGMGGWHEVQRAERTNQVVRALGFEVLSSPSRLWFGIGSGTRYLMLPDYSDNPYQWTGFEFNSQGDLETSWSGGELLEVTKDLHEVVVRGDSLSAGQTVTVYYEVDRTGYWTYLGEIAAGSRISLPFPASTFGQRAIGDSSTTTTINLAAGSTTDGMAQGDWVRINGEVRQISSITDADTFVLYNALSVAPASGEVKISTAAEGPPAPIEGAGPRRYRSHYKFTLIQVVDDE